MLFRSRKKLQLLPLLGLHKRAGRKRALHAARRRQRQLAIEGLETRALLATINIDSPSKWNTYCGGGKCEIGDNGDHITISAGITTDKDISIHGKSITIQDGVNIHSDGDITIEAKANMMTFGINALNQIENLFASNLNATITVGDSVVIQGDKVEISAESGDPRLLEDSGVANVINSFFHKFAALGLEYLDRPDLLSLPLDRKSTRLNSSH